MGSAARHEASPRLEAHSSRNQGDARPVCELMGRLRVAERPLRFLCFLARGAA